MYWTLYQVQKPETKFWSRQYLSSPTAVYSSFLVILESTSGGSYHPWPTVEKAFLILQSWARSSWPPDPVFLTPQRPSESEQRMWVFLGWTRLGTLLGMSGCAQSLRRRPSRLLEPADIPEDYFESLSLSELTIRSPASGAPGWLCR